MNLEFHLHNKEDFNDDDRKILASMLKIQNKVKGDLRKKIDRCLYFCYVTDADKPIAIGAIKKKTDSDFNDNKSGLIELFHDFDWELGYIYISKDYEGQKLASRVVSRLLSEYGQENLMASTEISANPAMVKILENNGFRLFGKPWKSQIHKHYLGLFLKFK